jgi:3-hydroxyacyl-[acyl-carrier-protein] dehydratase
VNLSRCIATARISGPQELPDGHQQFEFRFPASDPVFAGHFPGRPVVPGVFQLEMIHAAMEWSLSREVAVREISRAKFLRPILPDELVCLSLKLTSTPDGINAHARFSVGGQAAGEAILRCAEMA